MSRTLSNIGIIYNNFSDYDNALDYSLRSLKIVEKLNDIEQIAYSLNNVGNIYFYRLNYSMALKYYTEAFNVSKNLDDKMFQASILNNLGAVYANLDNRKKAIQFYSDALKYYMEIDRKAGVCNTLNNIGIVYTEMEKKDSAFYYFNKSLEIAEEISDTYSLANTSLNMAELYINPLDFKKADYYLSNALKYAKEIEANDIIRHIYRSFTELYSEVNNFEKAFFYQTLYLQIHDTIFNEESDKRIADMEVKYETDKKEQQIIKLEEEKEFREKITLYLQITSAALLLTILISIYTFYLKIRNSKQKLEISKTERQKQELELAKKTLENENLEKDLELKHKELTANAMNLIRNIEANSNLFDELNSLIPTAENDQKEKIRKIIRSYKIKSQDKGWKEFELRFGQVHKSFYQNLSNRFPDLSPNDKKICAFLRLNMTTKDIALLTYKSVNTINQARKRLRKKMNLSHEENLITYLSKL
jgi:tetratricopeptide (TPR) repeat protein